MKYKILLLIISVSFSLFLKAQDTLFKTDGSKLIVKVIEITKEQIKYKSFSNLDGPTYIIDKKEISKIVYQNGSTEIFTDLYAGTRGNTGGRGEEYGRHYISINILDMIFNSATIAYEYTLSPDLGIKIPLSVGTNLNPAINYDGWGYYSGSKIFSTGISLNIYPKEIKKASIFIGPSMEYGMYSDIEYMYNYPYPSTKRIVRNSFYAVTVSTGVLVQSKKFNSSYCIGLGVVSGYETTIAGRIGINLGYRF